MRLRRDRAIEIKTPEELDRMRAAGLVVARTLRVLADAVRPGVSTADLDAIAEREILGAGAEPSFLGYYGYPAVICTSVNEEIVHGIPSEERRLQAGDIISVDCGAIVDGWHGDAAISLGVGEIDPADQAMLDACEAALWAGIAQARVDNRLGDISHAVEESVLGAGSYGLIREYTGHGIGTAMHMDPAVPNYGAAGSGAAAPRRDGAGDRADDHPWRRAHRRACRRVDGRYSRWLAGRALRAHRGDHGCRSVGSYRFVRT